MEKIILVHYINVGNIDDKDISKHMEKIVKKFAPVDNENETISYWIPVRDSETRVECINPKLVTEDEFEKAKRVLDRNQKIVNEIIDKYGKK